MEYYEDDDKYARHRSSYLARDTELKKTEAKAVAYSERGYSWSGASKKIDVAEGTVNSYMERAMARYGVEIAESLLPNEEPPDYEPIVDPGAYLMELADRREQERWITCVERHQDQLPRDWVNDVADAAKEKGINMSTN